MPTLETYAAAAGPLNGKAGGAGCIFSVDVEDWFHILDLPGESDEASWERLPSRVEDNFLRLLDLLDGRQVRATCFFLGWVARRHPGLVREAARRGHEVASHGYAHRLVYRMTEREFLADVLRAKRLLEDIAGREVAGFRCAGFSVTPATPWFFERLAEGGHRYDSSVFPARRAHGGMPQAPLAPYRVQTAAGELLEFPISVVEGLGLRLCLFGGGYLRLFPLWLVSAMARRVMRQGRPVVFYIHPRDMDPGQPRLTMPAHRRFRSYVGLRGAEAKLDALLAAFRPTSFENYLAAQELAPPSYTYAR